MVATSATPSSKRIAVLFHSGDRYRNPAEYIVHHLAGFWREDGHTVTYLFGTRQFVPADLLLVHVNLSVVPGEYLAFAGRYPVVLNGKIRDIRKSTFSRNLVHPGDAWDGPVIVKSDLNYAGVPERFLRMTELEHRFKSIRRLRAMVDSARGVTAPFEKARDYLIYDRLADVPAHWFSDRNVVIERFRPEFEDGLYHTRVYQFLGDRWTCTRMGTRNRVVKAERDAKTESVEPAPEIVAKRHELGLDYGKLDYVINNGEAVLLDINKTTGASRYMDDEHRRRMRRHQAEGLYSYFVS
ncbi:MAG TPA: hypothetical protein VF247_11145 [Candidatus Krumholzibacteria bacterium]